MPVGYLVLTHGDLDGMVTGILLLAEDQAAFLPLPQAPGVGLFAMSG